MFDVIGKPTQLITGKDKVTGSAVFVRDIVLPHMLYARTLLSPYAHARIISIDTSEAMKVPGVIDVITGKDIPGNERAIGSGGDMAVLTTDRVRYIGDEIAAVIAVDEKTAEEGVAKIKVEYEQLPVYSTIESGLNPEVPIHPQLDDLYVVTGDVEKGLKEADYVLEDTYTTPTIEHCPSDTDSVVASFDGSTFTVYTNTQVPYWDRMMMARIFHIPQSKVRIIVPCNGSPAGGRNVYRLVYIGAACAWKVRRPVKMVRNREEQFAATAIRDSYKFNVRFGIKKDGTLTAMDCYTYCDSGGYIGWAYALGQAQGHLFSSLYKCPNIKYAFRPVFTNNNWSTPMRSFGNEEINFAIESSMDQLAKMIHMDPVELRLKNAVEANYKTPIGWQIQGCGLKECIEKANELIHKDFEPSDDPNIVKSIGLACGVHWTGWRVGFNSFIWRTGYGSPEALYADKPDSPYITLVDGKPQWRKGFWDEAAIDNDRSSCLLIVNEEGSVVLHVSDPDLGQGTYTVMAMIAAEILGIQVSDIKVIGADTDSGIFGFGTYSSRTTFVAGRAVMDAAYKARAALAGIASEVLGEKPENLCFRKGNVFSKTDPEKTMKLADAAFRGYATRDAVLLTFKGQYDPGSIVPDKEGKGSIAEAYPFLAQAVEVEVDKETGEVRVVRVVSCHDSGRIINPSQAVGQVQGALVMGLSLATSESLIRKDGRCINPNFTNYHVMSMDKVPGVTVRFVEQIEPNGPFGAKGLGEPAVVCMPGAIANAIENAVGVRIKDLPITPSRVLGAIVRQQADKNAEKEAL
ncbi:xanthine dehydrogenase family protein molybdopterin-binding subunit [Synergistes jonesii]|uniref:Aldehyde oxidase/xanthine dehydrogenase a/b hammerhead domain-containing protein n=1 Tax=Synergistes jonesii TaxID=2754 RepID=A0A073J2W7_9BACT|nr:xanthine dehydrogenase family protein molybdopterin-binding subunit [Synergistes jonesii]KEJ92027.1 hypothetical protein EH55_06495 [Synergistes jonesii]OFB61971.1 hypothetical protein JS73_08595 [Synergistes jonesii]OFB62576.1 hypothetical protein JS79_09060 [Synergistes jonesii]OFB64265.1 hypothetical protein JS72_04875 [Synergistes jonesii]OFB67412.1 hypothetical protein JS78_08605 [Synergistes jonesii]